MSSIPVILWNNCVATRGSALTPLGEFKDRGDGLKAFREFIERLEPQPTAIRILYGSETLSYVTTTCAKGSRENVRQFLSAEYPALSRPETCWAAHRVLMQPVGGEASTVLYTEETDTLPLLRAVLEEINVHLEGVFPILTALDALPRLKMQGAVALLHSDAGGIVYTATSGGERLVHFFHGAPSEEEIQAKVTEAFAASAAEKHGNFIVLDASSHHLPIVGEGGEKPKEIGLGDLLDAASSLDARGISNLLPPKTRVAMDKILFAVAAVLAIGALFGWNSYVDQLRASEGDLRAQREEQTRLEGDNAHLLSNKTQIESAESVLSEATVAPTHKWKFLNALNEARPVPISIRSVTMTEKTWAVSGYIHEGLSDPKNGPYEMFLEKLSQGEAWSLDPAAKAGVQKSPDFTITGIFK